MNVRVQFYAQLRELMGIHELELELPQGATVRELLEKIYAQKPALRAHDKSILIGAGLEFVESQLQAEVPGRKSRSCRRCKVVEYRTAGILLVSLDRHVVARAAFQRANAPLF